MRLYPLKVAKVISLSCLCACIFLFLRFHEGFSKSVFESEKYPRSLRQNQHGRFDNTVGKEPVASRDSVPNVESKHSRNQRSAMSVPDDRERTQKINDSGRWNAAKSLEPVAKKSNTNLNVGNTELSDIFISVKTTQRYHSPRVQLLLDTWVNFAKDETYFFTDAEDEEFRSKIKKGHLINTNCSNTHSRQDLCCKMAIEFDTFLQSEKRWFCHFDDDVYVNIPELVKTLQEYNHIEDWYLGKPATRYPMEIHDSEHQGMKIAFWFATGSGFCISKGLALKMMPHASGGRIRTTCEKIRLPDDCTIGYIIEFMLKKKLTVNKKFHSHLEGLVFVTPSSLRSQISFSYVQNPSGSMNAVRILGFSPEKDPTRFKTIHCHLYRYLDACKNMKIKNK